MNGSGGKTTNEEVSEMMLTSHCCDKLDKPALPLASTVACRVQDPPHSNHYGYLEPIVSLAMIILEPEEDRGNGQQQVKLLNVLRVSS